MLPVSGKLLGRHASVRVQQPAHRIGARQALPGMLAVNIDQLTGNVLQLGRRSRTAIDPGPAFPLQVDGAAQEQAITGFKTGFAEPVREARGAVEFCADFAAVCTFSNDTGVRATAQRELKCIDQY